MSCCNFDNRRPSPIGGAGRFGSGFDDRRGCCNVNWGPCRDNRNCPRRGRLRPWPPRLF